MILTSSFLLFEKRGKRTSFNPERESFRNTDTVEDSQSQRGMNSAADILAKAR